ncbi:putative small secreted protein [Hartmannibacter diazotrophicus]|uniref:Putative small secreted protein n=1 Tax=Hartmannibacter diazotrophicus TaxID=1482074 RepID=A0A2C9D8C6_9HYPH|nr:entericidin A/B family lipoprotein [Hartmannibacter diazotrophicus]SON56584.1 putative small secreted protein [Hartmannibacter diazotrophicus]
MTYSKICASALAVMLALGAAACDKTIRGAGQDIKDSGQAVKSATR